MENLSHLFNKTITFYIILKCIAKISHLQNSSKADVFLENVIHANLKNIGDVLTCDNSPDVFSTPYVHDMNAAHN